jgi:hypothetical protein
VAFAKEWESETSEDAEAKSFWDGFFNVFGVSRRRVATFEQRVHSIDGKGGYVDLLWKGTILVEHKSRGKNLDKAYQQAKDYFPGIKDTDLPRYVLVSDFARFRLYDLDEGTQHDFYLKELPSKIHLFGFMSGYQKQLYPPQDPVNIKAAESLGRLHDQLKAVNYVGHELEMYLVRLLFCLFADDTGIFEKNAFRDYIQTKTKDDGSDLAAHLSIIFDVLSTPEEQRLTNLDEDLKGFPYVNGELFKDRLRPAAFDSSMRYQLLSCCILDWSRISPAIFGSLFQSVMNPEERRAFGAHYTTETNILKVIRPLFLDDLYAEFEYSKNNPRRLEELHDKMSKMKFLDPACGCGNFLVIAYRELRILELEILKVKQKSQQALDVTRLSRINVDQFFGIEIKDFPAQIAQVALWLMDHQMNMVLSSAFGQYYIRLPLTTTPGIHCGNALNTDWTQFVKPSELSHILGNPPFTGSKLQSDEQRKEMSQIFKGVRNSGILDYVAAWYIKAAEYIQGTEIKVAFVSTKSITQGEQVGVLWSILLDKYHIHINFAHRTFKWSSEARGKAAVHCVIIGFSLLDSGKHVIFDYETPDANPYSVFADHINPYLVDAPDILLFSRKKPICDVPKIGIGNKPIDDGNYLFNKTEMEAFVAREPEAAKWMKPWIGADEFINGYHRYCLWLGDCPPDELRRMPEVMKRVESVRQFRLASKSQSTRDLASIPTHFHVENMPKSTFIAIPETSSEQRKFIPIGFMQPDVICSNAIRIMPEATIYHFGVLTSSMHMAWVRYVGGRLKSDYRYSIDIVYNNYPWPNPNDTQKEAIEDSAKRVLLARERYRRTSLADLYDPRAMPRELVAAHSSLDAVVENAYGKKFNSDAERVAFLLKRYMSLQNNLDRTVTKIVPPSATL